MSISPRLRGGVYVDGFNLYHALDDLKKPYLKWLNLRRLAESFARGHAHQIDQLVYCTALFPGDFDKSKRHERYIAAQESVGARVLKGHIINDPTDCRSCGRNWQHPREKESDINVALAAYSDVIHGLVDVIFLVTADTDQAATLRFLKTNYPLIKRIVVVPPRATRRLEHLRSLADSVINLNEGHIDAAVFPALLTSPYGKLIARPAEYAPPLDWVHPDNRPR
jgi:hypothetical protein